MSTALNYLLLAGCAILQTTAVKHLALFHVTPNLVLVLTVCVGLTVPPARAAIFGAVAGLLLDATCGTTLGFQTVLLLYAGLGISYFGSRYFRGNLYAALFCTFVITLAFETVYFFFSLYIFGNGRFAALMFVVAKEAVYNTAAAILLYYWVRRIAGF